MSDSRETRRADALSLLQSIFAEVGDGPIDSALLDPSQAAYSGSNPTSWDELSAEGLVLKLDENQYVLTPGGWAEALARADVPSDPQFLKRVGQLCQVLKAHVKGRHRSILVPFEDIVKASGLPSGWVFNVIDSRLISRLHGRKDAFWFQSARGRIVDIPRDFGLESVDLFADLRAENERLKEEAEHFNDLYGYSRCSTCLAPLVTLGQWEHEYGSEEVMEYACGMTVGAPNGDVPCTRDPRFPKFEEFELITRREGNTWLCYASHTPKSRFAGSVHLTRTCGKTEDEARQAMKEAYLRRAAPWKG
jgi:hypothetical protein